MEIHCFIVLFLGVFSSTIGSTLKPKRDVNLEDTDAFLQLRLIQMETLLAVKQADSKYLQWKNEILGKIEEAETESKKRGDALSEKLQELTDNLRKQLNESLNFGLENFQTMLTRNFRKPEEIETRSVVLDDIPEIKNILTYHSIQLDRLNEHLSGIKSSGNKAVTPVDGKASGPTQIMSDAPDLCQDSSIDTVTRILNGNTYVFKGDFYWEIVTNRIADGYPRKISDDWDGLIGYLDASLTWLGKTFFFKGGRYWRFTNKVMDSGFPKLIREGFAGIPDNLDAACFWNGNGKPYFFKGDHYWRFDVYNVPQVAKGYPAPLSAWKGLPAGGVDAAFQWENNQTYFFKGDKYYGFDDKLNKVPSPPYPLSTSAWVFGC